MAKAKRQIYEKVRQNLNMNTVDYKLLNIRIGWYGYSLKMQENNPK
jgi:hypothetical protein